MITASDPSYQDTLLVKTGHKTVLPVFQSLLDWVNRKYSVRAINVFYDILKPDGRPRIEIIFESADDLSVFREKKYFNFKSSLQKEIARQFVLTVSEHGLANEFRTENCIVNFSDFSAIARSAVGGKVPLEKRSAFLQEFQKSPIWEIHLSGAGFLVFFYEQSQVAGYRDSQLIEKMKRAYFELIKPYDEFGYVDQVNVGFYSKENFEREYGGNWMSFYR